MFRWLIDVSVIQLLEEKKIEKSDFVVTENYHTRLGEYVAKLLIEKINLNFNARYNYKNGKNYDDVIHTITSGDTNDGPIRLFDSGLAEPDVTCALKFDVADDYLYFCMVHP